MNKKVIVLSLSLSVLFSTQASSQPRTNLLGGLKNQPKIVSIDKEVSKKKTITLKSRDILIQKETFESDFSTKSKKEIYVKLKKGLKKSQSDFLDSQQIHIKQFVGNNTYILEVNESQLQLLKKHGFIEGFADILPNDKITKRLKKESLPQYAVDGSYVKVVVSFYKNISFQDAKATIKDVGGKVLSEKLSFTNRLKASIPYDALEDLANDDAVQYIEEIAPPISVNNINAGKLSKVFWEDNDGLSGLFDDDYLYRGNGVNVAIEDAGFIDHPDFAQGQINNIDGDFTSYHSTHVAGTIGLPIDTTERRGGMSPLCHIFSFSFSNNTDYLDDFVSAIDEYDAPIINNSWGLKVGYHQIDNDGTSGSWLWYNNTELFGAYNYLAQDLDEFMSSYYNKNAILVKSAGNERKDDGDGFYSYPPDGTWVYDDDSFRIGYYDCVPPGSCAKNIITVGAVGTSEAENESSSFSSWGPTDDGRIKPDVVADGYALISTVCNSEDDYASESGTSMSAPVVTGIIALIFEAYKGYYNIFPSADIVKALLCNFAMEAGRPGPDPSYGYGIVDARKVIDIIDLSFLSPSGGSHIVQGHILETDDELEYTLNYSASDDDGSDLKVTLAWIDPPSSLMHTKQLVNDLDLIVYETENPSNCFYPFYLDDNEEPTLNAKNDGPNHTDNVEQVIIDYENLCYGNYTVKVTGYSLSKLNQNFALTSSLMFDGFHFNNLSVWDTNKNVWVSHEKILLENTPAFRLKISILDNDSFDITTLKYKYSNSDNNGVPIWSQSWLDVSGVYEDEACTITCNTNYTGHIAYVKINDVPFSQASITKNKIKFCAEYQSVTYYSSVYLFRNYNIFYVDNDGTENGDGSLSSPWNSINQAISFLSSIVDNDTEVELRLNGGIYEEDIVLADYVNIYGGYDNEVTVIYGSGSGPVVIGADNVVLEGVTITGGKSRLGGGIYLENTSPEIRDCIIDNNGAVACDVYEGFPVEFNDAYGGGLYAEGSSSKIINTKFLNNYCETPSNGAFVGGGGAFITESNISFENCTFENNKCTGTGTGGYGGAICCRSNNYGLEIINCSFKSNQVLGGGRRKGGAIYSGTMFEYTGNAPILVIGSLFYSNTAILGGAISCEQSGMATLTNCTLIKNNADIGGGIHNEYTPDMTITNCILWANSDDFFGVDEPTVSYTCSEYVFSGSNNLNTDPLLVGMEGGGYHLRPDSPCINAGSNSASGMSYLETDLDGEDRIDVSSGVCDMGVDEVHNIYYVSATGGNDQNTGERTDPWATIQHAIDTIQVSATSFGIIMVQGGTYNENITLKDYVMVFGSYDSNWERDLSQSPSIINGNGTTHVVTGDDNSTLDGFTIQNGSATNGGGVYLNGASSTISNCCITDNTASYGGGVYVYNASPNIISCTIDLNEAAKGGGIYLEDAIAPLITACTIEDNTASYGGGGVYIDNASPNIINCSIDLNEAAKGGGICIEDASTPLISDCTIEDNTASYGGGVYIYNASPTIISCTIDLNEGGTGGGIYLEDATALFITDCTIENNTAQATTWYPYGGAFYAEDSSGIMTNCTINDNLCQANSSFSQAYGGAGYIKHCSLTISNCIFESNESNADITGVSGYAKGGALYIDTDWETIIKNTIFHTNSAVSSYRTYGGAICYSSTTSKLVGCLIYNNFLTAPNLKYGYAISSYGSPVITNCTIYGNGYNGIYRYSSGTIYINNCIIWNNGDDINAASIVITNCCIEDADEGTNVIHTNPLFVDAANNDFHLQSISPCINTGDDNADGLDQLTYDIDGDIRIDEQIDIGADEVIHVDYYVSDNNGSDLTDNGTPTTPWKTIQFALDTLDGISVSTLNIHVQQGTYNENIVMRENINLYGGYNSSWVREYTQYETIISAVHSGNQGISTVTGANNARLDGFTITNGFGYHGGGIVLESVSPEIANCKIINNNGGFDGGGIMIKHSSPSITNCIIQDNIAQKGGGLYLYNSHSEISNCQILDNTATNYQGGGLYARSSSCTIAQCFFDSNLASCIFGDDSCGGGLCFDDDISIIKNSIIRYNNVISSKNASGGGISCIATTYTKIVGCLIYGNSADGNVSSKGAGIYSASSATITACTIVDNLGKGIYDAGGSPSGPASLNNSILWNNLDDIYRTNLTINNCCIQDNDSGTNVIDDDPLFMNVSINDYHLRPDSPCINIGSNSASGMSYLETDLDGEDRIDTSSGVCDIGVDEVHNIYYVSATGGNDQNTGERTDPWATIQHAIDTIQVSAISFGIIMVQGGTYNENITLKDYVRVFGSYDSNWERDLSQSPSIINGDGTTHVVTGDDNSTLDGFTIQNGSATNGGGVYINATSPTISNCRITDNTASYGGGVYIYNASPTIISCTIDLNEGGTGGGIYLEDATALFITDCTIENNTAQATTWYPYGGAFYAEDSSGIMTNCTINDNLCQANSSFSQAYGGAGYIKHCSLTISNCIFESNESNADITGVSGYAKGGALYIDTDWETIIKNTIFHTNSAVSSYRTYGGAICYSSTTSKLVGCLIYNNFLTAPNLKYGYAISSYGSPVITNCTIYGNGYNGIYRYSSGTIYINNCIIWNNGDDINAASIVITNCCIEDADEGTNVIHTNPLFVDAANNDFHLQSTSPCIDEGDDNADGLDQLTYDIDGDIRINEQVDIGADETE
ncbi:MAG: right-handed parallel beta-helix repeat-containing protein [Candidatus Auribacterota bacterium]